MRNTIWTLLGTTAVLGLVFIAPGGTASVGGALEFRETSTNVFVAEALIDGAAAPCTPTDFCTACVTSCIATCLDKGGAQAEAICTIENDRCVCMCNCKKTLAGVTEIKQVA